MWTRRRLIEAAGAGAALAGPALALPGPFAAQAAIDNLPPALPQGTRESAALETLPGKKPLIKLAYRPPNYESPIEYLRTGITPNDQFFVRYHLSDIPQVDAKTWKLAVGGEGANPFRRTDHCGQYSSIPCGLTASPLTMYRLVAQADVGLPKLRVVRDP